VHPPTPVVRHATRFSASFCGCNPDVRQLLISSGVTLCFGLKTIDKTDPIPRPTKRNVIAEFKSYSPLFVGPSISTSSIRCYKIRSSESLCGPQEPCHFAKALVFLPIRDPQGSRVRNFDRIKRQEFSRRRSKGTHCRPFPVRTFTPTAGPKRLRTPLATRCFYTVEGSSSRSNVYSLKFRGNLSPCSVVLCEFGTDHAPHFPCAGSKQRKATLFGARLHGEKNLGGPT
jgi:hypothetical protein